MGAAFGQQRMLLSIHLLAALVILLDALQTFFHLDEVR